MLKSREIIKPEELFEIVVRRQWFIIIPFCLSIIVGSILTFTLPRKYQAETLILVEPQRVPTNYVQPIVSTEVNNRITTISQQITSRSNLEAIINDFKLFSDPGQINMFTEDKIQSLRKRLKVNLTRARRGSDAFSISFEGQHPETVVKVANALATCFIDQNLKTRESQALGTNNFLKNELNKKEKELEKIEEALKQYKKRYMGELPEQLDTNLRILDRLQEQIKNKEDTITSIRNNLVMLNNQHNDFENIAIDNSIFTNSPDELVDMDEDNSENLSLLIEQLKQLKFRYTDRHPDIVRIKKLIAKIESKKEQEAEKISEELESESDLDIEKSQEIDLFDMQNIQKKELNNEINQMKTDLYKLNKEIKIYQERVENTPKREQELLSLQRDYKNMSDSYNSLLGRKLEAAIAVNMERQQKGEQFRILDHAKLPEKPVSPDMRKLFLFTLALGMGVGCGLIFLIEHFDTSFRSSEDIESVLGIPVFAILPIIYHPEDLKKQKVDQFLRVLFITISFVLLFGFSVLTFKGVEQTKEIVSRFITM
jgi:polysaccharide chain length determinant protein (PEP-CTERM system associated)